MTGIIFSKNEIIKSFYFRLRINLIYQKWNLHAGWVSHSDTDTHFIQNDLKCAIIMLHNEVLSTVNRYALKK